MALSILVVTLTAAGCTGGQLASDPTIQGDGPELSIAFAGDVNFEDRAGELLDKSPASAVGPVSGQLASADLAIVNLETPVTTRGAAQQKRYLFRTDARAVNALKSAGVDLVSLANNHTLDYGRTGLADTMSAAARGGLGTVGAGVNASRAYAPWRTTIRGIRVSVLAFSQVEDLADQWVATPSRSGLAMAIDNRAALAAVRAARAASDVVIVVPHWGSEHNHCPTHVQQTFASELAKAGADVILGSHAHVLQGQGYLGRTFVAYGMGNFLWGAGLLTPEDWRGGVLKLTLRGRTVVQRNLIPTELSDDTRQPVEFASKEADKERARVNQLRGCTSLERTPGPVS
ncbi:CapA family protein [Kribbella sp. NPDC051587]|uniref:CapA family protein n=1 Tax=Kribbella sp. NPDC051587 TaxID=3364119 RepID=UPI0037A4DE48